MYKKILYDNRTIWYYDNYHKFSSKNDLPTHISNYNYNHPLYNDYNENINMVWYSLNKTHRDNDLSSNITDQIGYSYSNAGELYRYNGYDIKNIKYNLMYYKFLQGICLERLKKDLND